MQETILSQEPAITPNTKAYVSDNGIRVKIVNGEEMVYAEDIYRMIVTEAENLFRKVNPHVQAAKDARTIVGELLEGLGGDIEKFKDDAKRYLQDIRATRGAVVAEAAHMTKELEDVRQFFLGRDYEKQVERLKDFTALCERLKAMKDSGFLDSIADTLLKLA